MNPTPDELQRAAEARELDLLNERLGGVLRRLLVNKFELPQEEADEVVWATLLSAVFASLAEPEAWAIAAACLIGLERQRSRGLPSTTLAAPPDATPEELEALSRIVLTAEALAGLPARGRDALRMWLFEQQSYAAIAAELNISTHYARTLVAKALDRLRAKQES